MTSRFRVKGRFDGLPEATVEIDRGTNTFTVRPLRSHRTYTLPLATVAEIVLWRIARVEAAEKARTRRARRTG
jgi:hypothetical protein